MSMGTRLYPMEMGMRQKLNTRWIWIWGWEWISFTEMSMG